MSGGVEVHHLHCPTCGSSYGLPLEVEREDITFIEACMAHPNKVQRHRPYFVTCRNGHRWSIKTLFRAPEGQPDAVLLGNFLGCV